MTNAERLVADINAMPIEDIRARIEWARNATNDELAARWQEERTERAREIIRDIAVRDAELLERLAD